MARTSAPGSKGRAQPYQPEIRQQPCGADVLQPISPGTRRSAGSIERRRARLLRARRPSCTTECPCGSKGALHTDTAGCRDHVFRLLTLGHALRAAHPATWATPKLYIPRAVAAGDGLKPMIGGALSISTSARRWDEILRLAASSQTGRGDGRQRCCQEARRLPRQDGRPLALREVGVASRRTLFILDWLPASAAPPRMRAGLNKGERPQRAWLAP